jgi:hypothetical protein
MVRARQRPLGVPCRRPPRCKRVYCIILPTIKEPSDVVEQTTHPERNLTDARASQFLMVRVPSNSITPDRGTVIQ